MQRDASARAPERLAHVGGDDEGWADSEHLVEAAAGVRGIDGGHELQLGVLERCSADGLADVAKADHHHRDDVRALRHHALQGPRIS